MKYSFVFTLLVCCVLQAASKTKNPAQKIYTVLTEDGGPYDVVHVIDGSGSVGDSGHQFAISASEYTNIFFDTLSKFEPGGSRAALVRFSEVGLTNTVFGFSEHSTLTEINGWDSDTDGITNLVFDAGLWTAIGDGLFKATLQFFTDPTSSNKRKVWLFTDGQNNAGSNPDEQATILKGIGAQLCIVGVGPDIHEPSLNAIASVMTNGEPCVFIFDSAAEYSVALEDAVEMLAKRLSKRISKLKVQVRNVRRLTRRKVEQAKKRRG